MSDDDEDLMPVSQAMAEWEKLLPMNHNGRILLRALTEMQSGELEHRALEGPEETGNPVWRSFLAVGTTADGSLKYFLHPSTDNSETLRDRDMLLDTIVSQPGNPTTPEEAVSAVPEPSRTLAFAYYGVRGDGVKLVGIAWKRDQTLTQAIGHLKLAIHVIRKKEAEAAQGAS